jgi:adenylate cyclase class 2
MQEIEAKFYISRLDTLETRLVNSGAVLLEPRVLETNLRFDSADNSLMQNQRVLRLRRDGQAHLTYKDSTSLQEGALVRREIEFEVSDFNAAREFLLALGYELVIIYEKYRTAYTLMDCEVVLDELPFGNFCEIEGTNIYSIRMVADLLGLHWSDSIPNSYLGLFSQLRSTKKVKAENLTFQAFEGMHLTAEDMGVIPADLYTN